MCPFIGHPKGISAESLALLDRALTNLWRDQMRKNEITAADTSTNEMSARERQAARAGRRREPPSQC